MMFVNKISFSRVEINKMLSELDDYIWIAVDTKRNMIATGNETIENLKRALIKEKCSIGDIFGVGLDPITGDIDFSSGINIKISDKTSTKEVPEDRVERVESIVNYFFSELPIIKAASSRPRYAKPAPISK